MAAAAALCIYQEDRVSIKVNPDVVVGKRSGDLFLINIFSNARLCIVQVLCYTVVSGNCKECLQLELLLQ
jgi:hypothetical protein